MYPLYKREHLKTVTDLRKSLEETTLMKSIIWSEWQFHKIRPWKILNQ
jgi:hypothetical protein